MTRASASASRLLTLPVSLALALGLLVAVPAASAAEDGVAPTATASAEPAPSAEPDVPTATERSGGVTRNGTRNGSQGMRVAWQTAATYASAPANESAGLNTVTVKPTAVTGTGERQQAVGPLAYGTTGASGFTFGGRSIPANSIWVARLNTSTEPPSVTSMTHIPRGAAGVRIVDVAETVYRDQLGFKPSLNRVWMLLSLNGEAWATNGGVLYGADPNMSSRAAVATVYVDGPTGALSTGLSVGGSTRGLNCGAVRAPCAAAQPRSLSAYVTRNGGSAGVNVLIQGSGNFSLFDRQVSGGRGKAMIGGSSVSVQGAWSSAVPPATRNPSSVNALESFPLTDTLIASNYSGSLTFDERTVRARGQAGRGAALVFLNGGTSINDPRRFAVRNIESTGLVTITAATGSVDTSTLTPRYSGVVAGYFSGSMTLGGTTLTAGQGRTVPFIAKAEETRTGFDWAWAAQGRAPGNVAGGGVINAIAETPNGVRIAGTMWGTLDFGPHRVTGPWAQTDPQALFAADYVAGSGWTWAVGSEGQTGSIRPTSLLVLGSGAGAVSGIYGGVSGTATIEGATIGNLSGCRAGEPVLVGVDNCASVPFGVGIGVDTARPTPPNNVTASGVNQGVYVQWEPPVNDGGSAIASYTATVRNFNDAVSGTCTVDADAPDYSCTIGGLIEVPYRVSVTATNAAGRTSPQSAAIAFVPLSQTPSAPRDVLVIIEVFTGTFQVSWGAPADSGGSAITSYTATARAADGSTRTCTTSANRCNIDGLTLGETYSVAVTATNSAGRTSPASPAQVLAAEALPGPVVGLVAFPGNGEVVVRWAPPENDGGSPIIDYTARASTGQSCVAIAPETTCTITGLTNGVSVTVEVTARTDIDPGPAVTSEAVTPNAAPDAPVDVEIVGTPAEGRATITWQPPPGGAPVASYEATAYRSTARGLSDPVTCTPQGPQRECTFTGLQTSLSPEQQQGPVIYAFTVVAIGSNGLRSAPATPLPEATIAGRPTFSSGSASALPEAIEVGTTWNTRYTPALVGVATATPGGQSCTAPVGEVPGVPWRASFSCAIEGLTNGTAYTVSYYVTSAAGNSDTETAPESVTPAPVATVPGLATGITATTDNAGNATVRWRAPASDPRAPTTGFVVRLVDEQGVVTVACGLVAATATSCVATPRLTPGRSYTPSVVTVNGIGQGLTAFGARPVLYLAAPGPVRDLTAQPGPGQVSLQWEPPAQDGGGVIKQYDVSIGNEVVCRIEAPANGCLVRNLNNDQPYTFAVTAANADRAGEKALVSATPRAGLPGAPRNVGARPDGQGGIKITWQAPSVLPTEPITTYEVVASIDGEPVDNNPVCSVSGSTFECVAPVLDRYGVDWTFTVRAVTQVGAGTYSAPSLPVRTSRPAQAPRSVLAQAGSRSVSVSWTAPADDFGSAVRSYLVRLSPGGATCQVAADVLSCTLTGLTNGTAYTANVAALNAAGFSEWASAAPVTPEGRVPGAPLGVQILANQDGAVAVSWSEPEDPGTAVITGYTVAVTRADNPGGAPVGTCATQADLTCVIEGLPLVDGDRVASYVLRVSARSVEGDGPWSAPIAFEPGSGLVGPPDPVTDVLGLGEDRCIVVSWVPSASNGGLPITSQTMNVGGASLALGLADTQQRVCGLTNGDAYDVQVFVKNALGEVGSEVISVTPQAAPPPPPPPAAPPQAPSAPVGVAGNTVVELTWAAAPTADADQVSGYHVQRRVAGTDAWADVTDNTGTSLTRLTVTSLANGRGYEFRVRAINADGPGPWSDASAAVTPRSDRPGAPGRPVGTAGNGEVALQWAAPQSDGGGEIVGYQVEMSTDGQNWVVAIPDTRSGLTAVTVTGLTNGTSYVFRVAAINDAGVGDASDTSDASVASEPSAPVQPLPPVAPAPPGPPLPPPPPPAPAPVVGPGPAPGPPPVIVPEQPQPGRVASPPEAPTATAGVESARVNWKKPANAGTGAVTRYWVQATPGGLGCESTTEEPLTCVVTGLTAGTSYTFTVEAINPVGFSLPSEPSNAVVPTEAKKGTIAIKATRAKPTQIVVRGTTTGLAAGMKLTPRYRVVVNGKGKWLRGKALTLKKEGGTFTFRIKVKPKQTVQVKVLAPGKVKSNTLTVAPRR